MPPIFFVVLPLVVLLLLLIINMNEGEHFAPQAYYRCKRGGAPLALGYESLGPRRRKHVPMDLDERAAAGQRWSEI